MTSLATDDKFQSVSELRAPAAVASRDIGIDTMRGIAILMVIGIHSLQQPLSAWATATDAVLRPCVPIFLFVSGYLTALSGKVPLWKRLKAAIIPYTIAFAAAYIYMAMHNPAMDHRPTTALARFGFAYVFVYYYVFAYIGCTILLWLVFSIAARGDRAQELLVALLLSSIMFGIVVGSYLNPLLSRLGFSENLVEEVRMRDVPFWFSFVALGALAGLFRLRSIASDTRLLLIISTFAACAIYAGARIFRIGDAADYDSMAFFGYAALLCSLLLALDARLPPIASLGSGSYFIYLWHIFLVMLLRDHVPLRELGPVAASAITYAVAACGGILALVIVREIVPPRLCRWLGA
jgi:fucose 4-O-acetylase-like acetyltransferase